MSSMKVFSIVPRLPPLLGGVGSYALCLAKKMHADAGIDTQFILSDLSWPGLSEVEGFSTLCIEKHSANALSQLLNLLNRESAQVVVLHLAGYGYAKWSLYYWLLDGLRKWKKQNKNAFLITMFHELYCPYGKPWKHSFWVSFPQRHLVASIALLSDRCFTNCHSHSTKLNRLSKGKFDDAPILPVFSNVGEPEHVPLVQSRKKQLVVFGKPLNRQRAYERSTSFLQDFCRQFDVTNIVDVGSSTNIDFSKYDFPPVVELGEISEKKISDILLESTFGWLSYGADIDKSGVLAAYMAHGVVPVVHLLKGTSGPSVYYKEDTPSFICIQDESDRVNFLDLDLQEISNNAFSQYQFRNLRTHAFALSRLVHAGIQSEDIRSPASC